METKILSGKPVAKRIKALTKEMINQNDLKPVLVVMIVGHDSASEYYIDSIIKQGAKQGVDVQIRKSDSVSSDDLAEFIHNFNSDSNVSGIIVQKPLPKSVDEHFIGKLISPEKDVDGVNPITVGHLYLGLDCFIPCTAEAILEIIKFYDIKTEGKHIVVVGRSNVIGKPVYNLLLHKTSTGNATVTVCHSKTKELEKYTKQADVLITAVGSAKLIKKEMIKENCIIIDAGINKIGDIDGKSVFVGDVDYDDCFEKCQAITPVPGGVGSVTTSVLLNHVVRSKKKMQKIK